MAVWCTRWAQKQRAKLLLTALPSTRYLLAVWIKGQSLFAQASIPSSPALLPPPESLCQVVQATRRQPGTASTHQDLCPQQPPSIVPTSSRPLQLSFNVAFIMPLHQYDYILAIGTMFAVLDAYNNGASEYRKCPRSLWQCPEWPRRGGGFTRWCFSSRSRCVESSRVASSSLS
jgi:hypothetical protein